MKTTKADRLEAQYRNHPVALAIMPLMDAAVERAEKAAVEHIARVKVKAAEGGWDLTVLAPVPASFNCGRAEYQKAKARRMWFLSCTSYDSDAADAFNKANGFTHWQKAHEFIKADADAEARFIEMSKAEAAAQYVAFVWKLCAKVGDCDTATISGEHVWSHSILTVEKGDKDTGATWSERWKTQTIINVSVYGKLFNQWPSRKVK